MNRRTFLASLAGVAIIPAVAPRPTFTFDAELAARMREVREHLERMDAQMAAADASMRPVLQYDELSRYVEALTREQHAHLNQRSLHPVAALR